MLDKWLKDDEPVDFAPIEGVGPSLLRDKLHMKEPAIIIAYAMLQIDAIKYANTFKEWANNRKSFIPRLHI